MQDPNMDVELQHQLDLKEIYQKRLYVLEQQAAKFGIHVPAYVVTEIDETRQRLAELAEKLNPLAPQLASEGKLAATIYHTSGNVYAPAQLIGRDYLLVRAHALLDRGAHVLLYGLAGAG